MRSCAYEAAPAQQGSEAAATGVISISTAVLLDGAKARLGAGWPRASRIVAAISSSRATTKKWPPGRVGRGNAPLDSRCQPGIRSGAATGSSAPANAVTGTGNGGLGRWTYDSSQ